MKRVTFPTPAGPVDGYQLRFQLASPGQEETWTDWLHLPNPLMLYLTASLDEFLRKEGHLATTR